MKFLYAISLLVSVLLAACDSADKSAAGTESSAANKRRIKYWVAPMDPNYRRDKPGKSPMGMDLIPVYEKADRPAKKTRKIKYWVAPMDPNYRRDKPGKSPMGMDLIPVYEDGDKSAEDGVRISPVVVNNMGVRVATVKKDVLRRKIETVAYIEYDENQIYHVHMRAKGWIQTLKANTEGMKVRKGDLLFEYYSPELVNAQQEYVQALILGNRSLIRASRDRLRALDIPEKHIRELTKTRKVRQLIQVRADRNGVVAKLKVRQGMYVVPNTEIMAIADLSKLWIQAEVFGAQANWIRVGQPARLFVHDLKNVDEWKNGRPLKVEYVYPNVNQKTRTLKVRFRIDNTDEMLKPNMFAHITIDGGDFRDAVLIPSSAVIRTGKETRVIVAKGDGRFSPRQVVTGVESGGMVEIFSGLKPGEKVVVSGQFLIDSEASFSASLTRMKEVTRPSQQSEIGNTLSKD